MTEQICTNIEQSKKLIELGLREDTADLYITMKGDKIKTISNFKSKVGFPSWSLAKLVEILKKYPVQHTEIWFDIEFFDEIFNEVCYALTYDYCSDYWSDEKNQNVRSGQNQWSEKMKAIRDKLPKLFKHKWPDRKDIIDFFEHESAWNRDGRLGRIYRTAADELKAYEEMLGKPRLMLQWSRNIYGYHHLSAWALNDKNEGCYEYAVVVGINKLTALWKLARQMHRMGYLHLLRYVVKQETMSDIQGRVKHFRIDQVTKNYFLIRQRHTLLFFIHFYDSGAEILCPDYRKSSRLEAREFIAKVCLEKGYDYRIHEKQKED